MVKAIINKEGYIWGCFHNFSSTQYGSNTQHNTVCEMCIVFGMLNETAAHIAVDMKCTPWCWQPILSDRPLHPLTVPLSCGSGESSTGALCVRYWDEPWDFLCFWAFLTDFRVNPSTFSDAEMADILMHKLAKTCDKLSLGQMKGFLFCISTKTWSQPHDL